jgi:hypothetical protein
MTEGHEFEFRLLGEPLYANTPGRTRREIAKPGCEILISIIVVLPFD